MARYLNKRAFTAAEDRLIIVLHDDKNQGWSTIGATLKRAPNVVAGRYQRITKADKKTIKRVKEIEAISTRHVTALIEERARRELARTLREECELRSGDVTASFFGDPPPGYSALDQKRAGKRA